MLPELIQKVSLFYLLHRIDIDLAKQLQQGRCPYCNGPLHHSNYERKPRGGPENIPDEYLVRQSLCCGRPDCRRRTLPPSCLFMGRRVYWGCVILVVMTLPMGQALVRSKRCLEFHARLSNAGLRIFVINSQPVLSGNGFVAGWLRRSATTSCLQN